MTDFGNIIGPTDGRRRWGRAQNRAFTDPYKSVKKPLEPTVCPQCGAVYHGGRWQWAERPPHAYEEICQACRRINDKFPAGLITIFGSSLREHKDEILHIIQNQERIEKAEHPFNRIMKIDEEADKLVITTTDIHLPRRIGESLKSALHGELTFDYEEDAYFVRVSWKCSD